jgi:hypothetical protein
MSRDRLLNSMNLHEWPPAERPRERLLAGGAQSLSDAELLAVLLGSSHQRGSNVVDVARALLVRYGSLRELLSAGRDALPRPARARDWSATAACRRRWSWPDAITKRPCGPGHCSILRPRRTAI